MAAVACCEYISAAEMCCGPRRRAVCPTTRQCTCVWRSRHHADPFPEFRLRAPGSLTPIAPPALLALGLELGVFQGGLAFHSLQRGTVFRVWSPCTGRRTQTCRLAALECVCGLGPGSWHSNRLPSGFLGSLKPAEPCTGAPWEENALCLPWRPPQTGSARGFVTEQAQTELPQASCFFLLPRKEHPSLMKETFCISPGAGSHLLA